MLSPSHAHLTLPPPPTHASHIPHTHASHAPHHPHMPHTFLHPHTPYMPHTHFTCPLHPHAQCTRTGGLDALFEGTIFNGSPGRNKIAVIGSGCSLATEPTAEVSHYYNISHVSHCMLCCYCMLCCRCCVALHAAVADPGNRKGGFQTIEREARGVNSAQSAQNLGLRPLPVQ